MTVLAPATRRLAARALPLAAGALLAACGSDDDRASQTVPTVTVTVPAAAPLTTTTPTDTVPTIPTPVAPAPSPPTPAPPVAPATPAPVTPPGTGGSTDAPEDAEGGAGDESESPPPTGGLQAPE